MYVLTGKRSVGVGGKIYFYGQKIQDDEYKDLPKRVKAFFEKKSSKKDDDSGVKKTKDEVKNGRN
ncbi:hypothetical protein Calab_1458 [Caldithrix abyssi DSM 13497]|uniref:Uncharacterized protein n=1 Tax=Caldithrix abyssi DSM 13497 TaxID=880073 RepID=H1XPV3_CALAY|nr:hypothetical protein [Caldithrix abyssi]APF20393.1 hypothetical protein Cabys_3647 [Caldithrix abyssi DSM 13497]EHO41079.1 hypothetical protein Calab_1458 [Caldithrix abyssi DSM 13497]